MELRFHDYLLSGVYGQITPELSAQAVRFWMVNGAIPNEADCLLRAKELVVVARNANGAIAGVGTAYVMPDPLRPGHSAYAYRTFIQPKDRVVGLFVAIFNASRDILKQTSAGIYPKSDRPQRILFTLENPKFYSPAAKRIFHRIQCSLAGRDPRGLEVWEASLEMPGDA